MTNHPWRINHTPNGENVKFWPLGRELRGVFDSLPDGKLLTALKAPTGRPGYPVEVLWRTYVAGVILSLPSFAGLIRALQDNPMLAVACGITSYEEIPSKFAYSRFIRKLSQPRFVVMVKDIMRSLTKDLYDMLPGFGKSVAIDSTDLKAWSNGARNPVADPDAAWAAKLDTSGKKKFYYGYKLHMLADTNYELPVAVKLSSAKMHDLKGATRVLSEARFTNSKFHPRYVICDAAYSSQKLRNLIKRQYAAEPIIKVHPLHKKALFHESKEWKAIYNRRSSVERLFGRLKEYRRLNRITVRRLRKVTVHCFLSVIVVQAQALHATLTNERYSVRQCVRAVA